jgi:hypothetical protein
MSDVMLVFITIMGFFLGSSIAWMFLLNRNMPLLERTVIILICGVLVGGAFYYGQSTSPTYEERVITSTTPIYSIHLSDGIYGSFSLGYGTVSSYNQYLYYKDSGTGGLLLDSVRADGTVIYQDENEHPYVRKTENVAVDTKTGEINRFNLRNYSVKYEIHVPKGTVVEEYKL